MTKPIPELKLTIETDHDLGNRACARNVLDVLLDRPGFIPERFGNQEPLRGRLDASSAEAFLEAWSREASRVTKSASFHFTRRKDRRYSASVLWWRASSSRLGSVHVSLPHEQPNTHFANEVLELALRLFEAVRGQYGRVCLREEFWAKNVTDSWLAADGSTQGGAARGTDLRMHLPGLYWANIFGPAYRSFFGRERLDAAPAFEVHNDANCTLLLTAADPYSWNSDAAREAEQALLAHLGDDAFFKLSEPSRLTRAPLFSAMRRGP